MTGRIRTATIVAAILAVIAGAWAIGLPDHLTLSAMQAQREFVASWVATYPLTATLGFLLVYVAITGLSLPGSAALSLVAGSVFGLALGTVLVSIGSTIGAVIAYLLARTLLRPWVERRFRRAMQAINRGLADEGWTYVLGLRLAPVFPFFVVNLVLGVTRISLGTFALISWAGMLPATVLFVYAGQALAEIRTPADVLSTELIGALVALAILPLGLRRLFLWRRDRQILAAWTRPEERPDWNIVVIGGGSAGLVAANAAATAQARVALVAEGPMGGDCLNTGCVPSKALIRAAAAAHEVRQAGRFGVTATPIVDFAAVMAHVRGAVATIAPHDSEARYRGLGVEVIRGRAFVEDPWTVTVGAQRLTTRAIIVATGAAPIVPPIPGLAEADPLTSETLWSLEVLPARLLVLGGGAIGCEMAQAFARLGSAVTLVEAAPRLLPREEPEASAAAAAALAADHVTLSLGVAACRFEPGAAILTDGSRHAFDRVLVAVGRRPRLAGFGLEALGVLEDGRMPVDDGLRSRIPTIWAAGDAVAPLHLTHVAGQQGWIAAMNALFGGLRRTRYDGRVTPRVTFTDPEIAAVGLTTAEATAEGIAFDTTRIATAELDRAVTEGETAGFLTILTERGGGRILGATIVGRHAGEMLAEITLAMRHRLALSKILSTIHPYPTRSEAARQAAAAWRRAHLPAGALAAARWWNGRGRARRPDRAPESDPDPGPDPDTRLPTP